MLKGHSFSEPREALAIVGLLLKTAEVVVVIIIDTLGVVSRGFKEDLLVLNPRQSETISDMF